MMHTSSLVNLSAQLRRYEEEEDCPNYEVSIGRSNSNATSAGAGSAHWSTRFDDPPGPLNIRRSARPQRHERYLYTYNMIVGNTPLQWIISVEPTGTWKNNRGKVNFSLSLRVNGVERPLGDVVSMNLALDLKQLRFVIFAFPGNPSVPANCQHSVRVWLRANNADHRVFGEDGLWIGKDPDFTTIQGASFHRIKSADADKQVYHGFVGKALVHFIVRWRSLGDGIYNYSFEYEGGGAGMVLLDDFKLRLQCDPKTLSFLIYTVPMESKPALSSHRLRIWLKSLVTLSPDPSLSFPLPFHDSYIYQRIFKSDSLKIGGSLDFQGLGQKVTMAFPAANEPEVVIVNSTLDGGGNGSGGNVGASGHRGQAEPKPLPKPLPRFP